MRAVLVVATLLGTASAVTVNSKPSYDGHKVFRVAVTDDGSHVRNVIDTLGLVTWQPPSKNGGFADVQVPAAQLDAFHDAMKDHKVTTMHENLGRSIAAERAVQSYADDAAGSANSTWFQSYHNYSDHVQWLNDLAGQYSKNAKIVTSGNSLQGNPITGLHIFGSSGGGKKPAVVFHGAVHAREWISSMVVEYMTNELISKYGSDDTIDAFVEKYDFYMFPIVNVDGFIYTQTDDRMWRKNRQTIPGSNCTGIDINRNWPYKWDNPGSSTDPCANDFKGRSAGDAPETKALLGFLQNVKNAQGLKLYMDYHAYSQLIMTPHGYSCTAHPNAEELESLATGAADAIYAVHNVEFSCGSVCQGVGREVSGVGVDYVADVVKADYTFAMELRDLGDFGFLLPPDQIIPSGEEAFAGVEYLLRNMK